MSKCHKITIDARDTAAGDTGATLMPMLLALLLALCPAAALVPTYSATRPNYEKP